MGLRHQSMIRRPLHCLLHLDAWIGASTKPNQDIDENGKEKVSILRPLLADGIIRGNRDVGGIVVVLQRLVLAADAGCGDFPTVPLGKGF